MKSSANKTMKKTMKKIRGMTGMLGAAAVSLTLPVSTYAQLVEEVMVTARKTEENLQETPLTITALTSKELADRGIEDLYEVSLATPGFQFEKLGNRYGAQNGGTRPVIRGMSSIGAEPNVAVFVDGILFSGNPLSFPMEIVERVEVIKGPQAALFGRSTFAGAINYITKKPTQQLESEMSARIAQYDDYEVNMMSRGPLVSDKLFFTLHARYYDFGGEYRNRPDNQLIGQEHTVGANGSLEYRPTDDFRATLSVGYNKDRDGLAATALQDRFSNNCFVDRYRQYYCGVVKTGDMTDVNIAALQGREGLRRNSSRVMAAFEYDFGNFSLVSNSGFFSTYEEYGYDSDYISAGRTGLNLREEVRDREEWSTELRLQSSGDQRIRWLGGVFYYERDLAAEQRRIVATLPDLDLGTTHVKNAAVFGSLSADLTDSLTASVELRYAEDKLVLDSADGNSYSSTNDNWTPRLTLDWRVTDDSMLYAVVAKGNKPGDVNEDPRLPRELLEVDEEEAWSYEIGAKNTLFEGRMTMNLAAFFIDWSKQQLSESYIQPDNTTIAYNVNVGKTAVRGLEYTMNIAFSDALSGGFSYGLNDARFVKFSDAEALALFGNGSLAGRQTPHTAKNEFMVFSRYEHQLTADMLGFIRMDFSFREGKYDQAYNLASTGDQKLLNLKLGVEWDKVSLTLFVDNVTDDDTPSALIRYLDNKNTLPIAGSNRIATVPRAFQYSIAPGRRVGLNARYKF